jgi:hypothetical protein
VPYFYKHVAPPELFFAFAFAFSSFTFLLIYVAPPELFYNITSLNKIEGGCRWRFLLPYYRRYACPILSRQNDICRAGIQAGAFASAFLYPCPTASFPPEQLCRAGRRALSFLL